MKTLNENLFGNFKLQKNEMKSLKGGTVVIATSGKHGNGMCVNDTHTFYDNGTSRFEWVYTQCK
ncbi:hypothetical protein CYCD_30540 [Tenuifilaceae bacterium CYCD]|nr:hypothetical protein CYCD_30540 [Tenuifilaceae bacterium CYCD]